MTSSHGAGGLAALLSNASLAYTAEGDARTAARHYERAYLLARRAGDAPAMATAALGQAGPWLYDHLSAVGAAQEEARLRGVLSLLDPGSVTALRVRARLAASADFARGGHDQILPLLDEAAAAGEPAVLAETIGLAVNCMLGPADGPARRELTNRLVAVGLHPGQDGWLMTGLLWQTVGLYLDGDQGAGRRLAELRQRLDKHAHLAIGYAVGAIDTMLAIRAGRLNEAEERALRASAGGQQAGDVRAMAFGWAQLVAVRWFQGRLGELAPFLAERAATMPLAAGDGWLLAARALAAAETGDQRTAASLLAALGSQGPAARSPASASVPTLGLMAEAAYRLNDAETARQVHQMLVPYQHLPMTGGPAVSCLGGTRHALGTAALTTGRLDQAITELRAAVRQNLALAHWPAVAASRRRLAQALAMRGGPGDTDEARSELAVAASEAVTLGLPAGQGPAPAGPAGLTCTRAGRSWRLTLHGRQVTVPHSVGLLHLAVLIAHPHREIAAADLAAGPATLSGPNPAGGGAGQPQLDRVAIRAYETRLRQLTDGLEIMDPASDRARLAQVERDWLVMTLAGSVGLGSRVRTFTDEAERARVAVGKAIRRSIARITERDAVIGSHLQDCVSTGARCSYWPA